MTSTNAMRSFTRESLAQRVVFGDGERRSLPRELTALRCSRSFLIGGGSASPVVAELCGALGHRVAAKFTESRQHVPADLVEFATQACLDAGADSLISVGGGRSIGLAKAIALEVGLPIIAIPTTLSGSEMTPIYGITSSGHKRTGVDPIVLPRVVIYDPGLYVHLPRQVIAPSALNSLAHAIGGMLDGIDPLTSSVARESIRILVRGLRAFAEPTWSASGVSDLVYGGFLGGYCLAHAGAWFHHKLCHLVGGAYAIPHSPTHAALLPHSVAILKAADRDSYGRIADALGNGNPEGLLFDLLTRVVEAYPLSAHGLNTQMALDIAPAAAQVVEGSVGIAAAEMSSRLTAAVEGWTPAT